MRTLGISEPHMAGKRSREVQEMVAALERHLRLLRECSVKAFGKGDRDFGGEVAGNLRLLVTKSKSNRPLLLDLMEATGIKPPVTLGGPPIKPPPGEPGPGDTISLERYLQIGAVGIRVSPEQFVMLNKVQLIRAWAEQTGSSHEDWSLDPALDAVLQARVFIGGLPATFAELQVTTEAVLHVAEQFLSAYHSASRAGDA